MPTHRNTTTAPSMQSYNDKMSRTGVKVKHQKARTVTANDLGKNRNGSYTSGGSLNQGYQGANPNEGRYKGGFTKGTSRSATGRMAEEGSTRAGGKTWTMTPKNDDGSPVLDSRGNARQSGRSQTATRRQRYYDVRVGLGLVGG